MAVRKGYVERVTKETQIKLTLSLDGTGESTVSTGIGFFDHMLTSFAKHGFFDLTVDCRGDLHVDAHHTVEDVGIALGDALRQACGDGKGIRRFGTAFVPMDEALVQASLDLSGRGFYNTNLTFPQEQVGQFPACLTHEFMRALAMNGGITLHLRQLSGENSHHIIEAAFKACARALNEAVALDPRIDGPLSTKGMLDFRKA